MDVALVHTTNPVNMTALGRLFRYLIDILHVVLTFYFEFTAVVDLTHSIASLYRNLIIMLAHCISSQPCMPYSSRVLE